MFTPSRRAEKRNKALSKLRIVEAAVAILDADGESALTVRALARTLATGSGAIYWYIAGKDDLLALVADVIITGVMADIAPGLEPRERVRALGLAVFDAIDAHPWLGAQLGREPRQPAVLAIFEGIGFPLTALDVPERLLFDAWSALVNYVIGVAGQNAASARLMPRDVKRLDFLATVAARWAQLDPATHPFLRLMAKRLPEHDDRKQFLAGLDLILTGIDEEGRRA